jgi:hypothetical protein
VRSIIHIIRVVALEIRVYVSTAFTAFMAESIACRAENNLIYVIARRSASNSMRWLLSGVIITIIANTITVIGHWPDAHTGERRAPTCMQLCHPRVGKRIYKSIVRYASVKKTGSQVERGSCVTN